MFRSTGVWDRFLPSDLSKTRLSSCSSYTPVAMLIDASLSTACCSEASHVLDSLAGGRFNDVDLFVHIVP